MPRYPLTYFEIQKYYKNEPKFNYVYSRKILPKRVAQLIILDEYKSIQNYSIALFVNDDNESASCVGAEHM